MQFILASKSPRRAELLSQMGMDFTIIPSEGEEIITSRDPVRTVSELSFQKAVDIDRSCLDTETVIIGADTIVTIEERILGKPADRQEAFAMLSLLQGRQHSVYTGVTLFVIRPSQTVTRTFHEQTRLQLYPMTDQEIWNYIDTGETFDKAGAYGIQGRFAVHIKEIAGDYNTVVGLPIARLYQNLLKLGIDIYTKS